MIATLPLRQRHRDDYRRTRDPICKDRLLWRAQTFRDAVPLMPGQSKLACGDGRLKIVYDLLKPGGQVLFYEINPWNAVLQLRRWVGRLFGSTDLRRLPSRPDRYTTR
jgi:hypothetical protein